MSIQEYPFTCLRDGLTIRGTAFVPEGEKLPAVIVSHGLRSTSREVVRYAKKNAEWGYAAFCFDFCGGDPSSSSDGSFQEMTVYTEIADLEAVIAYVLSQPNVDSGNLTLMGCSQGGLVSALVAAQHPQWAARLVLFYPAFCIPENSRKGQLLMYSFDPENIPTLVDDGEGTEIGGAYFATMQPVDPFAAIAPYPGPVLIVHGDCDQAVPIVNSFRAQAAYHSTVPRRCQLAVITGADHGFTRKVDRHALEMVQAFLRGESLILSIDTLYLPASTQEQDGQTVVTLPVSGAAITPFFSGLIQPGSVEIQHLEGRQFIRLQADLTLTGTDWTGQPCTIHIVNDAPDWQPTVTTDSAALSCLNGSVTASLESRKMGPVIRLFA